MTSEPHTTARGTRIVWWLAAALACAVVFAAWRDPHLMVSLATVIKACF